MATIKDFLKESKVFDQLPEFESLFSDERYNCKIYSAKGSIFERGKNFAAYIFFLNGEAQYKAFYVKGNFPTPGKIYAEEAPTYVQYESFEAYWLLDDAEAQISN